MTTNQIKLREVKEIERHNRVTEGLTAESNTYTREHYERADRASLIQAYAAQSQAAAAHRNAAVNEINAVTNRYNAETNRMAAQAQISYNAGMLEVAKQNAATNEFNAITSSRKVDVDEANQKLKESEFAWSKALDQEYLNLDRYKANLQGLQFKEGIRQFNLGYELDTAKFKEDVKTQKSERARNYSKALNDVVSGLTGVVKLLYPGTNTPTPSYPAYNAGRKSY